MKKVILLGSCYLFFIGCATGTANIVIHSSFTLEDLKQMQIGIIGLTGYDADIIESKVIEEFSSKGFDVIERTQIELMLKEQNFQLSGIVNSQTAVKIGKIIGVKGVFIGSVSRPSVSNTANWKDNTWQNYIVVFTGRLIDVETGKTLISGSATGKRGYANLAAIEAVKKYFNKIHKYRSKR